MALRAENGWFAFGWLCDIYGINNYVFVQLKIAILKK